jgi:hypothetical protein
MEAAGAQHGICESVESRVFMELLVRSFPYVPVVQ